MFDRPGILRDAHAEARRRLRYSATRATYRAIFAAKLRDAWHAHKFAAAKQAWEAAHPVPADILAKAAAIRADAWFEPITAAGNTRMAAACLAASALVEASRFGSPIHA